MPPAQQQQQRPEPPQPFTVREWTDLNLTESRLSIEDGELAFLENGMLLGKHIISVPLYGGDAGASLNPNSVVKESYGCSLTYGIYTAPHPVAIVVFEDGSAYMRDYFIDQPVDILVAAAGTFGASPKGTAIKIWQDGPVLFQDDAAGYCKWDGALFSTIDSNKLGDALVVFEGHVFLKTAPRTFTYTAPNSFSDFLAANGAGSFKITDDAFQGAITTAFSTVEQMWIMGASAVDALGNVATSGGVTSFSITNALTSLGTTFPDSVAGYFRSLTFYTGYSIHSLLGVTPQKLSAKIDRLFPLIDNLITFGPRVGVQELNGVTVLVFLFEFHDPVSGTPRSELLCFQEGKWFLAQTPDLDGNQVVDLVTLTIHSAPEVYGIDRAGRMYRIFARAGDAPAGTLTVSFKLYDFGAPTKGHQGIKVGLDMSAPKRTAIAPLSLTFVTERRSVTHAINENFQASADSALGLRYALLRRDAPFSAQRLGLTVQVECAYGVTIEALHLEHAPTDDFDATDPAPVCWHFTGLNAVPFAFTNLSGPFCWLGSRQN